MIIVCVHCQHHVYITDHDGNYICDYCGKVFDNFKNNKKEINEK